MLVDDRALLARAGQQSAVFGIVGLGGMDQAGVEDRLIHLLAQTFQLTYHSEQSIG